MAKINKVPIRFGTIEVDPDILCEYREMYENLGNLISLQYGGSLAHKQNKEIKTSNRNFEFLTSIRRHFNNNFTDLNKQNQIDLFLGIYLPHTDSRAQIWDEEINILHFPSVKDLVQKLSKSWHYESIYSFENSLSIPML